MDKDEPIDADAHAQDNDGRGSSADAGDSEQGEIDLREPVGDANKTPGAELSGSAASDGDQGVAVNTNRPAPPPPPDAPDVEVGDRPAPPERPAPADAVDAVETTDVIEVPVDDRPAPPAAAAMGAAAASGAVQDSVASTPARASTDSSTPLIDLGEAIADDRDDPRSAWWKYAAAIAVPVAVAAVLLFTLAGRGGDDDLPEFTDGEGTELATGADPDADSAGAADDDAVDATSDGLAADAGDDAMDDAAAMDDADAMQDEEASESEADDAADQSSEDATVDSGEDVREEATEESADDEPREAAERAEAAPTEVPDPTPEPEDSDSDGDATAGSDGTSGDQESDSNDQSSNDSDSDNESGDDSTTDATSGSDSDSDSTSGSQDADAGDDDADSGTSGSSGTGSLELADRTMTSEPSTVAFQYAAPVGDPYDTFTKVEHTSGNLAVSVPTNFTYVAAGPNTGDEVIIASTEEGASLDTPGISIRRVTNGDADELDELLAEAGPELVRDCATGVTNTYELPAPPGLEGLFFADRLLEDDGVTGSIIFYESCLFGEEPTNIVEAGLIDEQGDMVLITVRVATSADFEVLDRVLSTVAF